MRIYFAGVGGMVIGPLARIALDLEYEVYGSDIAQSRYTDLIEQDGIKVLYGQSGKDLQALHESTPVDWVVYSAALPPDNPELTYARSVGIRVTKRDEFINHFLQEKNLKLIGVSGTHGKTSTTALIAWIMRSRGIPVSYLVGTMLSWGKGAEYVPGSRYFVYETDEYDRNMLKFHPAISVLPAVDYDHPDIYPTRDDYKRAFCDFIHQSDSIHTWGSVAEYLDVPKQESLHAYPDDVDVSNIKLTGEHMRRNAYLAGKAVSEVVPEATEADIVQAVNLFPGTERRFEEIAPNVRTDYGHTPAEIAATLQMAREVNPHVIAVYQPHQNSRQYEVKADYEHAFDQADKVYWLPTYLSREDESLPVLQPRDFMQILSNPDSAEPADQNPALAAALKAHADNGDLVLLMSAGDLDEWARAQFAPKNS